MNLILRHHLISETNLSMKTIQIRCDGSRKLDIEQLEEFQGGLKDLSKENYERLKKEILESGFAFPIYVWRDGQRERIIGGHQRLRTLKTMRRMGYTVPPIPVIDIHADNEREARRRVLQDASQYGVINEDGFLEFLNESEFDLDFAQSAFRLPDMKWDKFFDSNAPEIDPEPTEGKQRSASEDVKSVVLKFDLENYQRFEQFTNSLAHKYGTSSVTDTILKSLERDFHS